MLSENNHHQGETSSKLPAVGSTSEKQTDADALKASYWAAMASSAHHTFTEVAPFQLTLGPNQLKTSTKSGFPQTQTSQWLQTSLFNPKFDAQSVSNQYSTDPLRPGQAQDKDTLRIFQSSLRNTSVTDDNQASRLTAKIAAPLPGGQTPLEVGQALDMLSTEYADDSLLTQREHWSSQVLNNPKLVAGIIGCCILSASVYAGLGYWWLTSNNPSQAAEPEKEQAQAQPLGTAFLNIKTLQTQSQKARPNVQVNPKERLIAQAEPVATFAMFDSPGTNAELTGRPDPFSPLIQENEGTLVNTDKDEDVLTGVQYSGFIGNMNSKDKIAIIKILDTNPAISPKTLLKKTGESFYINGERVYLKGVSKTGLTLQVQGANRTLGLNPYQVVMNNPTNNGSGSSGSSGSNGSSTSSATTGTSASTGSSADAAPSSSTGSTSNNSSNGINIKIEE